VQGGKNRYLAAVHDTRAAVQFLRSKAGDLRVDPTRIGGMGESVGAHLAALVALAGDSPPFADAYPHDPYAGVRIRVKVVVGIYGVYDLLAQWHHDQLTRPRDQVTENFLGKSPMESKYLFYEASPLTYTTIDKNHTAFLVVWGTEDDIVDPHSQSEVFVTALKQAGFFVRTVIVPGAPHFCRGAHRRADQLHGFFGPAARALLAGAAVVMPEAGGRGVHHHDWTRMTHQSRALLTKAGPPKELPRDVRLAGGG